MRLTDLEKAAYVDHLEKMTDLFLKNINENCGPLASKDAYRRAVAAVLAEQRRALVSLSNWVRKERSFFRRIGKDEHASPMAKERAFGEVNVCNMFLNRLDEEIKKLGGV